MKKKLFIPVCLSLLSLGLAACGEDNPSSTPEPSVPTHTHSWESAWQHDDSNHWHGCKDASCNEVDSKAAHTWDEGTVTKEPTEAEVGEKTYKCTVCDVAKTEEIAKLTHTHVKSETWSTDGTNHWKTCSGCDEKLDLVAHSGGSATCEAAAECEVCGVAYGEALGHTEVADEAVAPTCTEAGKTAGSHCSTCNEVIVAQQEVAALGHTEVVDAAVAPTCTEAGKTEGKHCSTCNEVLVAQQDVAALGHTEVVDAAVEATCTEAGKTEGKHCSVCETVLVAQEDVAALGHTEVVDAAVAPTHAEKGLTEGKHCSVCEEVLVAQQEVAALGHKFIDGKCDCGEQYVEEATGEWTLITELKDGQQVLIGAPAYGKLLSTVKTGFYNVGINYSTEDFTNVTDAEIFTVTVNSDGTYSFTSLTGKVIAVSASYASLDETSSHKSWAVEAKSGSEGIFYLKNTGRGNYLEWYASKNNWSTYTAKNTDEYELSFYARGAAEGAEHVHNYISEAHAPTCLEAGYTTFTCKCGETYKEDGEAALGHTEVKDEAVAPTCEEKGKTEGSHCSVCKEVLKAQEDVAELGHSYTEGSCSVCGKEDPAAHKHSYESVVTAPTCTEAGKTTFTCSCGDTYTEDGEPALGHIDENLDITCDREGCTKRILPAADSKVSLFTANHMIIVSLTSNYYVEGVITEITDAKNGVFIIQDEAGDTILIRLPKDENGVSYSSWTTTKVVVGDTVQVYGKPAKNSSTPTTQKAKVESGVLTVLKHEHNFSEATCTKPSVCACLVENAPALGHIDENSDDACDRCSWNMKLVLDNIAISTTVEKTNGVQTMGDDGKAVSWTWSNENFDVIIAKGTSTFTLYTSAKDYMQLKKLNTFTVVNKNGVKIQSITIYVTAETQLTNLEGAIGTQFAFTKDVESLSITIALDNLTGDFTFSHAGNTTVYISGVEVVYEKPVVEPEEPETPVEPEEPVQTTTTVYYYNNEWTKVNAYIWDVDPLVAWPGKAMTAVEGKTGWYSIEIEVKDLTGYNIIFNNGSEKTGDLVLSNDKLYYAGVLTEGYLSEEEALAAYEASLQAPKSYLYLTPNANWNIDNARFAAYFFGTGEKWVSMTDENNDGIYEVEIPDGGYTSVIFCRMNPATTDNNWNNKWNQTGDLAIPEDGTNHYTVTENTWDKGGGTWSTVE